MTKIFSKGSSPEPTFNLKMDVFFSQKTSKSQKITRFFLKWNENRWNLPSPLLKTQKTDPIFCMEFQCVRIFWKKKWNWKKSKNDKISLLAKMFKGILPGGGRGALFKNSYKGGHGKLPLSKVKVLKKRAFLIFH